MRQIESLRREAHCTYRAMRRLLFGGEQKETAMPFPTSKCGRPGGRPVCARGRGAHRRRNKGLRGEKHHAGPVEFAFGPEGVVPVDEGIRVCGEGSTTPSRRNSRLGLRAWCPSTKGQGFAGDEAPRRIGGRTVRAWGRGARRRRDKGLRGEKHHAGPEEETSVLPFRSARARPRAAPPSDGIKRWSCYSSSATS